jgi:hypothetical protein
MRWPQRSWIRLMNHCDPALAGIGLDAAKFDPARDGA